MGGWGGADGTGNAARFSNPAGVATDSAGNVYVADSLNGTIRKITFDGIVTTLAGKAEQSGSTDGTGSAARFYGPTGVATDSAGNVYVADKDNQIIRKITPAGVVTTLAGGGVYVAGSADGIGTNAWFSAPAGVVTDNAGNVYVADSLNSAIRKITPTGVVTTIAGAIGWIGFADSLPQLADCRWDTLDVPYDSMANTCESVSSCTTDLMGDGVKTVHLACGDGVGTRGPSTPVSYQIRYELIPPSVSIVNVAGDASVPYWNSRNDGVTDLVLAVSDAGSGVAGCRWSASRVSYASMSGSCTPVANGGTTCHLGSFAEGGHTVYVSCIDNFENDSSPATVSFGVDWTGPGFCKGTGGTVSFSGGDIINTFNSGGTFTPGCAMNVEALVVAGGGGGGAGAGAGGGGAGGVLHDGSFPVSKQSYAVTVGAGGVPGVNGSGSVFSSLAAIGGGAGANSPGNVGLPGGSGGGGSADGATTPAGGSGTTGQGTSGGAGSTSAAGGGGGGAGSSGTDAVDATPGSGGAGLSFSTSGSAQSYGGGGGGGGGSGGGDSPCVTTVGTDQTTSSSITSDCASTHRSGKYAKYFTFTLAETTTLQIDETGSGDLDDTYMFLLSGGDTSGSVIEYNDDNATNYFSRIIRTLDPGTYTVEASTYSSGVTGDIALTISGGVALGAVGSCSTASDGGGAGSCSSGVGMDGALHTGGGGGGGGAVSSAGNGGSGIVVLRYASSTQLPVTSVGGDTTAPYFDATDDDITDIVLAVSDAASGVKACRWSEANVSYASMANSCATIVGGSETCSFGALAETASTTRYYSCVDDAGNASPTLSVTFGVDWTAPFASLVASDPATGGTATLTVTASDALSDLAPAPYEFRCSAAVAWSTPQTNATYDCTSAIVGALAAARVTDAAGNQTVASTTITSSSDATPPTCGTWTPIVSPWHCGGTAFTLADSTDEVDGSGIDVAGGDCTTATDPNATCTVQIADLAGNHTTCTSPANTNVDCAAPTLPALSCTGYTSGVWRTTNPETTCSITDTTGPSPRTAVAYTTDNGTSWTNNHNDLSFTFTPPAHGSARIRMRVSDTGGTTKSNTFIMEIDTPVPPIGSVSSVGGSASYQDTTDDRSTVVELTPPDIQARFSTPSGIVADSSGNTFVADRGNHTIRKVTPDGFVSTYAGTAGASGSSDGTGAAARFNSPRGLAIDASGTIYVADDGNHAIRKVAPGGVVTTLAGLSGFPGSTDDTGSLARFTNPAAVAVDSDGNVYVADDGNHTIRKITPAGAVTTVAGTAGSIGSTDATGFNARFAYPTGIAVDANGTLYVADRYNDTVRTITTDGVVTTLAGVPGGQGSTDGTGTIARFNGPSDVAVDQNGNVFVADTGNHTIRKIAPGGVVTTVAGTAGLAGATNGTAVVALLETPRGFLATLAGADVALAADTALFNNPAAIAVDGDGNVYVADSGNNTIRIITTGVVSTVAGVPGDPGFVDSLPALASCRWSETDQSYADMVNACESTTSCTTTLTGAGTHTVYIACLTTTATASSPASVQVNYEILPSAAASNDHITVAAYVTQWITISADTPTFDPVGPGEGAVSANADIRIETNSPTGYHVNANGNAGACGSVMCSGTTPMLDASTVYDGIAAVDAAIGNGLSFRLLEAGADSDLDIVERWGPDLDPRYAAYPMAQAKTIATTAADSSNVVNAFTVQYNIKSPLDQANGLYTGIVTYTAVGNL